MQSSKFILVSWGTTNYCPLRCPHCYRDASRRLPDELSTQEARRLIEQIADLKARILVFSGGEPLAREDIVELVRYAHEQGLLPALATSGLLVNERIVRDLASAGLRYVAISLDSHVPEKHDRFRGVSGLWKKVVDSVRMFVDQGVEVQLNFTMTVENVEDLEGVVKLCEDLNVKYLHVFDLVPVGRATETWRRLKLSTLQVIERCLSVMKREDLNVDVKPTCIPQFWPYVMIREPELWNRLRTRHAPGCIAGRRYLYVSPTGDVYPCPYLPYVIGNVRSRSLLDIVSSSGIISALERRELKGKCRSCRYVDICGGCRAKAYALKGDLLDEDPDCPLRTIGQS